MNEELKYCKFCNKQKPKKDFCKSGGFTKNICRECHNKKQKERYANSKLVEEKDKEIERLNNIINELEKEIENRLMNIPDDICDDETKEIKRTTKIAVYQVVLGKLKELKGDSSNE